MHTTTAELKQKIQNLSNQKIRFLTQLEELSKAEQVELEKLSKLGITDVSQALHDMEAESARLKDHIERSLQELERV